MDTLHPYNTTRYADHGGPQGPRKRVDTSCPSRSPGNSLCMHALPAGARRSCSSATVTSKIRGVPGGGQVSKRATTPKPKQKAGADPATAESRRGAEPAEHLRWCRL